MFMGCLEKIAGLRDLPLPATGKPVMCLKMRYLSPGLELKGNQL
jgi:hypothetical protein